MATRATRLDLKPLQRQSGVVLVFSILVLLVLTVLGVASMSSSNMQERMAGNANLEARAFEAASAGVANSVSFAADFFDDPDAAFSGTLHPQIDLDCGSETQLVDPSDPNSDRIGGWYDGDTPVATPWSNPTTINNGMAQYRQRLYCLISDDVDVPRSRLFVESRGEALAGGQVLATREIEVRVDLLPVFEAGQDMPPIYLDGATGDEECKKNQGSYCFPNSGSFVIDGNGGPAVGTGNDTLTKDIFDAAGDDKKGTFEDGIETIDAGAPWNDPELVLKFIEAVKDAANDNANGRVYDSTDNNNTIAGNESLLTENGEPQTSYFPDGATFNGSPTGEGILVVEGDLNAGGTPEWKGLILVIGGSYSVNGSGNGGMEGTLVILNPEEASDFGPLDSMSFAGGGNATYKASCEELKKASALDSKINDLWNPDCNDRPDTIEQAGIDLLRIVSWRENIGWREASDFGL